MALTANEISLLNYIEQEYLLHGSVPTEERCLSVGVVKDINVYRRAYKKSDFREALEERGIPLYNLGDPESGSYVLTPNQLVAANVMLDLRDNRSQKKKLQELGIPTQTWEAWLRDPAFQHYIRTRAENILGDNIHESHLALVDRVRSGDVAAIKYFNEITGRYVPAATGQVDVAQVLMRVLEVIQRFVLDPATQSLIADELLTIASEVGVKPRGGTVSPIRPIKTIEALPEETLTKQLPPAMEL